MFHFDTPFNRSTITAATYAAIGLVATAAVSEPPSPNWNCGTVPSEETLERTRRMVESGEWAAAQGLLDGREDEQLDLMFVAITAHIVRYNDGTEGIPQYRIDAAIEDLNTWVQNTNLRFFQEGDTLFLDDTEQAEVMDVIEFYALLNTNSVPRTLNIYFVPYLDFAGGVATFPDDPIGHGIVIENTYVGIDPYRAILSHEAGHYFGLYHTHETAFGPECVDGTNCGVAGDLFCDTPADPDLISGYVWSENGTACLYFGEETDSCNGDLYDPPTTNIMSYTPSECMNTFTLDQLSMVRSTADSDRSDHLRAPGACCVGGECNVTPQAECLGSWEGEGTDCSNYQCALLVPDNFPTIQDAIDASWDGDTILVGPGTYTSADPSSPVIRLLGRAITLRSADGAESTIIDGEGLRQAVACYNGESAETVIDGFTITGGAAAWGGGIYCGGSSPTFKNCVITNNTSSMRGGGVYCHQGDPTFNNCIITKNTASAQGGGAYCNQGNPAFNDCSLTLNTSDLGGGLYANNSNPVLTNCTVGDNSASITGGGLYAYVGSLEVVQSRLCHNLPNHSDGHWNGDESNFEVSYCAGCDGDVGSANDQSDSVVDLWDIQTLLAAWGTSGELEDLDGNGIVGVGDLLEMLMRWGPC